MNIKKKMLLDAAMAVMLVILLKYSWTGGLIHEIIGVILIAGFIFHIICNRYYLKVLKKWNRTQLGQWQNIIGLMLNVILLFCTLTILISSLCISRNLFTFLNNRMEHYSLWCLIHVVCTYTMLSAVLLHAMLHYKTILGFLRNHIFKSIPVEKVRNVFTRVLAAILVAVILKTSVEQIMNRVNLFSTEMVYAKKMQNTPVYHVKKESKKTSENEVSIKQAEETQTVAEADTAAIEQAPEVVQESLDDYLSKLTCTGCGKHCCLLTPQCGTGRSQAQVATEEYQSTIGE